VNLFTTIKLVFRILLAKKGRSFLTVLGIMIGVAGVIIIISLGAGAQTMVLGQITKLGSNMVSVQPGKSNEKGPPAQVFGVTITTLTTADANVLRNNKEIPHATAVNAVINGSATVSSGNKTIDTNFIGTDSSYPELINFTMSSGKFFDARQNQGGANVVVLGSSVAEELFTNNGIEALGQVIKVKSSSNPKVGGVPLRVIGVIAPRGSSFFQDQDDQIMLPLNIGQQQLLGIHYLKMINIKVDSTENIDQTIEDISLILNRQHHIKSPDEVDYTVRNMASAIDLLSTITDALRLFLAAMAAISLVVGGIGIMNIMMATVGEQTREVGLRKAVGANNSSILKQFLLEASILTTLGGIVGIIIGSIISYLIFRMMLRLGYDWSFVISPLSIILAVGVSILTGIIFGIYPAIKASKLDPIEALRYE
jgi:putative ABC transport system permease protein